MFFRIYLPLITPSLIAIGTYAFFYAWNEYLYAVLLLQGEKTITLPVGMGNFLTSDDAPWNLLMALSVIYAIPPVLFYYVFRRYLTHGLVSGSVQGDLETGVAMSFERSDRRAPPCRTST